MQDSLKSAQTDLAASFGQWGPLSMYKHVNYPFISLLNAKVYVGGKQRLSKTIGKCLMIDISQ